MPSFETADERGTGAGRRKNSRRRAVRKGTGRAGKTPGGGKIQGIEVSLYDARSRRLPDGKHERSPRRKDESMIWTEKG